MRSIASFGQGPYQEPQTQVSPGGDRDPSIGAVSLPASQRVQEEGGGLGEEPEPPSEHPIWHADISSGLNHCFRYTHPYI